MIGRDHLRNLGLAVGVAVAGLLLLIVGNHLHVLDDTRFLQRIFCLLLGGAALFVWSEAGLRERWVGIAAAVGLTVIAADAILIQANGRIESFGTDDQVAEWGVFHYYLGGKYFAEMQYTDLYEQAVIADWDGGAGPGHFADVKQHRELHDYKFLPVQTTREQPRSEAWSDARWEKFKADVDWFGGRGNTARWTKILSDRGYNPPPSYVLVSGTLCNILPISSGFSQTLLVLFDMLLLLTALIVSTRAYGYLRSIFVLCVFVLWYGNNNRVFGQIWILDWFAVSWMAAAAWKLKRPGLSGGLIAYAACVRVFPLVLFAGPLVVNAAKIVRERRVPPTLVRFFGVGAIVAAVMVGGSTLRYGVGAWQAWGDNITEHNEEHQGGARRFGLKQVFVLDWSGGLETAAKKIKGRRNLRENKNLYRLSALVLVLLAFAAMTRVDEHDAMLLGSVVFFAGTVASRYYGALMVLLLLIGLGRGPPGRADRPRPLPMQLMDFAMVALIWTVYSMPTRGEPRLQYVFSNTMWAAWWLVLLVLILARSSGLSRSETTGRPRDRSA